jgi:glycogen synthase
MYDTILYALGCCSDKKVMRYLIQHAMEADFSFDLSAEAYARLYVCML